MKTSIKPIRTPADYESALAEAEALMDARAGSAEADRLEVLSTLIEKFEDEHHYLPPPDPIEAIKFRMDQMGMSRARLGQLLGSRSRATEILERRRRLTVPMIRSLHEELHIPAESLIGLYSLSSARTRSRKRRKK